MSRDLRPLVRVAWQLAPFAGAALLAWVAVIVGSTINWTQYALSAALLGLAALLAMLRRPGHPAAWLGVVPSSLVFLAAVALLRNSVGGMTSGAGALALVPVFYTALYSRSRRDMLIVLAGVAVFYLAPIVIVGAPSYPDIQYRAALLSVAVSSIIGLATQGLVADVRHRAAEARSRELMLAQVSAAVHGLFESPQVRVDVCEAARAISSATSAALYEPLEASAGLRCTVTAGFAPLSGGQFAGRDSPVYDAFASGRASLVTQDVPGQVGSVELWTAAGRPASVLYQPLMKAKVAVGVLVLGWPDEVRAEGPGATVAALLAHEAAAVIDRADTLNDLADAAQTDPLTGLPNRRAWDAEVQRAPSEHVQRVVAILDLDRFKEFNDTYGHPAGDRLLKETAAAWRDELRSGDFLARIGGEEFGVLLGCQPQEAGEIVERLRDHVTHGATCSAGIATRLAGENADAAVARADHALYQAKAQGRDRTYLSPGGDRSEPALPAPPEGH